MIGKNVLVTGGAGFIGAATTRWLLSEGYNVVVLDDLSTGRRDNVPDEAEFVYGDVCDYDTVHDLAERVDAIVHLAGRKAETSLTDGTATLHVNVLGTDTVISTGKPVVVASDLIVGQPEDSRAISLYELSKRLAERHALKAGSHAVILRYATVAGAWLDGSLGRTDSDELIPRAFNAALAHSSLVLDQRGESTIDGTNVRDYVHVMDVARANEAAVRYMLNGGQTAVMDIVTGDGWTDLQIVKECERIAHGYCEVVYGLPNIYEPPVIVGDVIQASKLMGWQAHETLTSVLESEWVYHQRRKS